MPARWRVERKRDFGRAFVQWGVGANSMRVVGLPGRDSQARLELWAEIAKAGARRFSRQGLGCPKWVAMRVRRCRSGRCHVADRWRSLAGRHSGVHTLASLAGHHGRDMKGGRKKWQAITHEPAEPVRRSRGRAAAQLPMKYGGASDAFRCQPGALVTVPAKLAVAVMRSGLSRPRGV